MNVQGDEPVFDPADISTLLGAAQRYPGEILNGVCELQKEEEYRLGSIPKAVMRLDRRLLYMSRSGIPTTRSHEFVRSWRQVCAYVFPRKALEDFAKVAAKTPLEQIEDIEILRFLELGWDVRMIPVSDLSVAVDTPADVERVRKVIQQRGM